MSATPFREGLWNSLFVRLAFNRTVRLHTWKKLAKYGQFGLSLDRSLRMFQEQAASVHDPLAGILARILRRMEGGHTLGAALTGFASSEEILLIASGQAAGKLPEGLLLAGELLEAKKKISSAVVGAVAYPVFLLSICIGILIIIATQMIPELSTISDPKKWTGNAALLYGISTFVSSWKGVAALLAFLVFSAVLLLTLPLWTGPLRRHVEAIPPWSLYRLIVGSVWLFTIATLMRSGMGIKIIFLNMMESESISPYLKEKVRAIFIQTETGKTLGEAMRDCGMNFPDRGVIHEMIGYASLPDFQDTLYDIAKEWMNDGLEAIERNVKMVSVAALFTIVFLVCGLSISIMDIQTQLLNVGGF